MFHVKHFERLCDEDIVPYFWGFIYFKCFCAEDIFVNNYIVLN